MDHFIVNVSGLSPNEKQAVNKDLAKITGCKELECQSSKAIFFYAPCPAIPNTISWDYDQYEKKPTHTPQEIIAMAEQLNTKRKVRADFDKRQPITVNVKGYSEDIKKQVIQAFFDVGLFWSIGDRDLNPVDGDVNSYTNLLRKAFGGTEVKGYVMWSRDVKGITPDQFFSMVYEDEPQDHPHAELMMAYAEDAKSHAEPWKLWQVSGVKGHWDVLLTNPKWDFDMEYRRKPKTHLVHGVEVPDIRPIHKIGEKFYFPNPTSFDLHSCSTIDHGKMYGHLVTNNLCYEYTEAGKQAAILHAKIMLGIA